MYKSIHSLFHDTKIYLGYILFPVIIRHLLLQLEWSPSVVNQSIGHDLERPPAYISCSWQCMSEHQTVKSKELWSVDLRDRIVSKHIIRKWKKFGMSTFLLKQVTNHPVFSLTELQCCSGERGEPSRRKSTSAALQQSGLHGSGQTEATPQ